MKYRKKPVEIDTIQWTGHNWPEVFKFITHPLSSYEGHSLSPNNELTINTLERPHYATIGDWIIRGVEGELYPCKPKIFEKTYEKAN